MPRVSMPAVICMSLFALGCGETNHLQVSYSACSRVGGYDRIQITRQEQPRGVLYTVNLLSPAIVGALPIITPPPWYVESARAVCACDPTAGFQTAVNATGKISWQNASTSIPSDLSIHVILAFAEGPSWLSPNARLEADGLELTSACARYGLAGQMGADGD
jgi:hypothetical protein